MNAGPTVGYAVMAAIAAEGVDTVFGIPGTHNLELYRPLRGLGIRAVTTRHEQGAGFAADGWAARTGRAAVVLTTSGPGLLNVLAAAATAYAESRPMLVISPGPARGSAAPGRGTLHETKDQSGAADAVMRWSRRVRTEVEAIAAVRDAFRGFATARPQPVHIEIPLDLLESESTQDQPYLPARPVRIPGPDVALAAAVLGQAERPIILAGGGAVDATEELAALAERLGAPVVTTINGKGALPETHPLSLGSELRLAATVDAVNRSDVLLIVGSKRSEAELWDNVITVPVIVRTDRDVEALERDQDLSARVAGDAGAALRGILAALPHTADAAVPEWLADVRRAQEREAASADEELYALAGSIRDALPADAVVTADSSQIIYHALTSVLRQDRPRSFLYMATFATLGYALPAAIGARLASPDRPVVCIAGDGALLFSVQELMTAVELGLDLTVLCIDNGGYGEIRQNQLDRDIEPIGVELQQPDWVMLASSFGATAVSVTPAELQSALARAIASPGVQFIHVRIPSEPRSR